MPEHSFFMSSGCLRGYTAEYIIEDEKLYGIRYETDLDKMKKIKSEKFYELYKKLYNSISRK